MTTVEVMQEDKKIKMAKIRLEKVLLRADKMGFIAHYDGKDYPEYIHSLWASIKNQPLLAQDAAGVEDELGNGDTIQLLSDAMFELFGRHMEEN